MKDLKYTLKRIATAENGRRALWREWTARLWRQYLALALAVALAGALFLQVSTEVLQPVVGDGVALADAMTAGAITAFVLFVVAAIGAVVASVAAHRAMRSVVGTYAKTDISRGRRNLLLVESVAVVGAACWVAVLPAVVIYVCAMAAKQSAMMGAVVATPAWAWTAYIVTLVLGLLLIQMAMTIVRLAFRTIPTETIPESTTETHDYEQTNDNDNRAADDGDGERHGVAAAAQNGD